MDELEGAIAAAKAAASKLGLAATEAVVLQSANRVVMRLKPCEVIARVAPLALRQVAAFEVGLAQELANAGCPIAKLAPGIEPGVHIVDRHAVSLWTYYEPLPPQEIAPAEYAAALKSFHSRTGRIRTAIPHFTDRVDHALRLIKSEDRTPDLSADDRAFLTDTLSDLVQSILAQNAPEQALHGEPHLGNLLRTAEGILFVDLETFCRGPVAFDVAHAPEEAGARYRGIDRKLLARCRILMLAMIAAWRWDREDRYPDSKRMAADIVRRLRRIAERRSS